MKSLVLTYLVLLAIIPVAFSQQLVKSKVKKQVPAKYAFNASLFQTPSVRKATTQIPSFEFGISKRINDESKKNRLSVGTDFGVNFQNSLQTNYYLKPTITYNINVWKNFYFKPRVSAGVSVVRNNTEYVLEETGSYKRLASFKPQILTSIGVEPNYTIYNSKNYSYNLFARYELQNQSPTISKLLPVTMWHIGLNVQPNNSAE